MLPYEPQNMWARLRRVHFHPPLCNLADQKGGPMGVLCGVARPCPTPHGAGKRVAHKVLPMKTAKMIGGIALMFLAASMLVSAYHIPTGDPARNWTAGGVGNVVVLCESTGPADPVNALPVAAPGIGGLCYASCEADMDNETLLEKK